MTLAGDIAGRDEPRPYSARPTPMHASPAQTRHGCPLPAVTAEASVAHDDRLNELAAQGLTTMHARLLGIASGEVDADDALALVSVLVGSQMLARATRGTPMSDKLLEAGLQAAEALLSREAR